MTMVGNQQQQVIPTTTSWYDNGMTTMDNNVTFTCNNNNPQQQRGNYRQLSTVEPSTSTSLEDTTFLPNEFFYVREEVTPKASRNILFICAIICYAITIVAFVGVLVTEIKQTTTETVVSNTDLSSQSLNAQTTNSADDDDIHSGGWSCQMLSKVSQSGVLDDTEEPILSYSLLKINENYQQCKTDIAKAQPCDYSLQYGLYMIDSSSTTSSSSVTSNTNYFDNNGEITYITTTSSILSSSTTEITYLVNIPDKIFTQYNQSMGQITAMELQMIDNMENIIPGIITSVDGAGHGYIGGYEFHRISTMKMVYSFVFINELSNVVLSGSTNGLIADATLSDYTAWGCAWKRVLQDNAGLSYGITEAGEVIVLPLWDTPTASWWKSFPKSSCYSDWNIVASLHENIEVATLYWVSNSDIDNNGLHIFYINWKNDISVNYTNTLFLYHYHNNKTILLDTFIKDNFVLSNSMSITVDNNNNRNSSFIVNLYFGWNEIGSRGYFTNIYTIELNSWNDLSKSSKSYSTLLTTVMTGFLSFTVLPDKQGLSHRLLGGYQSSTDNLVYTTVNALMDPIHETQPLKNEYKDYVKVFSQTKVGWLLCNDTMIPPTQVSSNFGTYSLTTEVELERKCTSNAISWYASFDETYYFTTQHMYQYSSTITLPLCSEDEYIDLCEVVGDLPPYACSRQVRQSIFTIISAAVANSQLVLVIVCFATGSILQFISSFQKKSIANATPPPQVIVIGDPSQNDIESVNNERNSLNEQVNSKQNENKVLFESDNPDNRNHSIERVEDIEHITQL